ncbi:MAG: hypothetical protein HYY18_06285 [Planctomycetes bacterium]|nr:hypothetical protein [Planctomycetota bacterium]
MLSLLAFILLCPPPPPGTEIKTAHYDLYAEGVDPEDTGAMLEALHKNLTRHFGAAPADRLRVEVYATYDAYKEGMKRDKEAEVKAGGYYAPGTKKAYLWVQPSAYFTRQLILHEATHQFHYLAATRNKSPTGGWYVEGIAEYFGMHNWDGKELKTGVVPAVTLEDYPAQALKQFDDLKQDLEGIVEGRVAHDRPLGWALFHYLINNHPKGFRAVAARLDEGAKPGKAWEKAFGKSTAGMVKGFRAWMESHAQPWRILWVSWQERGDRLEGKSDVIGIALLKEPADSLEAEVEVVTGTAKAGLVFGFRSGDEYLLLQVLPGNRAQIARKSAGVFSVVSAKEYEAGAGAPVVRIAMEGKEAVATVNGTEIGRLEASGALGLNAEGCGALFRVKGR